MSAMSEFDMIVSEGIEYVKAGDCLCDAMRKIQDRYNVFCEEYDYIMDCIVNAIPNKIYI